MAYTQAQLDAAFDLVEPASHWKDPIDAIIIASKRDVVAEAIIHFTATIPTFTQLPHGKLAVKAAGYWAGPAAGG